MGDDWRVYEFVARHFLGTVSSNCKYTKLRVQVELAGEHFTIKGKKVTTPGFTEIMHWLKVADENIPDLSAVSHHIF